MATGTRPAQVTLAGWSIMIGSVLVVITAYDTIAGLTTIDTREATEKVLADSPPWLTMSVDQMLEVMRWSSMAAAAAAAASVVLGWQAMQRRSKAARVALSVLAVPLFIGGVSGGGFFAGFVAAGVMLLWMQPSRDWYDGITRPAPTPSQPTHQQVQQPTQPQSQQPWQQPAAQLPPPTQQMPSAAYPMRRPSAVFSAAMLTWGFCALSAMLLVPGAVLMWFGDRSELESMVAEMEKSYPEIQQSPLFTGDLLLALMVIVALGLILWAVAASVIAWLALRGIDWARILLIVSAACAGLFMATVTLTLPFMLVPVIACGVTVWLLLRPEVSAWYAEKRRESLTRR